MSNLSEGGSRCAGPVRVIGVGNLLMGDDGVGPMLVSRLAGLSLPPCVEVIDGGTGGITLLGLMEGASAVILVDAAELGRPPGTIARLAGPNLDVPEPAATLSSHHSGLAAALALGRELGLLPKLVLFLVQAAGVEPGTGLSGPVQGALESLQYQVFHEAALLASPGGSSPQHR